MGCDSIPSHLNGQYFQFQSTHPRGVRQRAILAWPNTGAGFNPRTRVGCDTRRRALTIARDQFQSTHPRGVRPVCCAPCSHGVWVSIHAPAWGATIAGQGVPVAEFKVSIHAPAWGATHTRMLTLVPVRVSIHAPAWGATTRQKDKKRGDKVSIHAPAWGATDGQHVAVRYAEFQSTHPRGVRRLRSGGLARHGQVSIHAPAWGATFLKTGSRTDYPMFQSTHPRGVRHAGSISHHSALSRFNPRTRVGCDLVFPFILIPHFSVSIHAPAWGATSTSRRSRRLMWVSIHAPAWGATSKPVAISPCRMMVSIHAPAWGATQR